MSLAGLGAVAIWHDLLPAAKDDFYEWHNREHMPERVGIPGFRRGRRFVAISGAPEFFNLYEADSPETLSGQDYLNRLNAPTAWTQRVIPSFRNVARSICRVAFTNGVGSGGVMLTLRFAIDAASSIETAERKVRADTTLVPSWIVLIEGISVPDVDAAADDLVPTLMAHAAQAPERAVYRLEFTRLKTPWTAG